MRGMQSLRDSKRTAWVAARVFLADNDEAIRFNWLDAIQIMEGVAAGRISEKELAEWFRLRLKA